MTRTHTPDDSARATEAGYNDALYDGMDLFAESELLCKCDVCKAAYYRGQTETDDLLGKVARRPIEKAARLVLLMTWQDQGKLEGLPLPKIAALLPGDVSKSTVSRDLKDVRALREILSKINKMEQERGGPG